MLIHSPDFKTLTYYRTLSAVADFTSLPAPSFLVNYYNEEILFRPFPTHCLAVKLLLSLWAFTP